MNKYVNSDKIIERVEKVSGWTRTKIAKQIFEISKNNLWNRINSDRLDFYKLFDWAVNNDVNAHWLIYGVEIPHETPEFGPQSPIGARRGQRDTHDFWSDENRNDFHSLINGLRLFQKITEEYPRLKADIEKLNSRLNAIETDMKKNKPPDGKEKRELWKKYLRLVK